MEKPQVDTTLQKSLTGDLKALQSRLEHYENQLVGMPTEGAQAARVWSQIEYYQTEVSRVRSAVLELHAAALKELKR